ncbi:MAG TPA: thioredoxin-like domain-containing protein [Pyrinomonadaceae bacterium]|nr:thioredoxin-like domain-containing protein [Pyrinomonadaceae bacterium]
MPVQERSRIRAPELTGDRGWLNTDKPLSLAALKGKVVLLDFWTYGCINCIHIIPDLKKLEKKYPNELVVIGVHSAKFENEKDTENIRQIILRYEIEHPIVNDADFAIWKSYAVNAWPTRYLIDPAGYIIGRVSGEGYYDELDKAISESISEFRKRGELNEAPLKLVLERAKVGALPLSFPGKILADAATDRLFMADSDHNRIVITKLDGTLVQVIGTGVHGADDGQFDRATFFRPQGLALDGHNLYVADTENHLIRQIDLKAKTVKTIAGTGEQSHEYGQTGPARTIALNSPWDLQLVGRTLYMAMAGPHQIWQLDLNQQAISTYAGSGREARIDGPRDEAGFAQPSGLATDGKTLFVSDAEANIIRGIDLAANGQVRTLVGGDLFDFGDEDGTGNDVRLQHPLGLARWDNKLLVADTYNHKIKVLDPAARTVRSFAGTGKPGQTEGARPSFYEPGGLAVAGDKLYVADTNNHAIRVVDLKTKNTRTLVIKDLQPPAAKQNAAIEFAPNEEETKLPVQKLRTGDASIVINVQLPAGYHLNPSAPHRYKISVEKNEQLLVIDPQQTSRSAKDLRLPVRIPVRAAGSGSAEARASFTFVYCREDNTGVCRIKTLAWRVPVEIVNDATAAAEISLFGKVGAE